MSFVIAAPEMMTAAASDLAGLESALSGGRADYRRGGHSPAGWSESLTNSVPGLWRRCALSSSSNAAGAFQE